MTLKESPSLFLYSFSAWSGTGVSKATNPSLALVVGSPTAVTGTSSYNLTVLLGSIAAAAVVLILTGALWIRTRRRRADLEGFIPGAILTSAPRASSGPASRPA